MIFAFSPKAVYSLYINQKLYRIEINIVLLNSWGNNLTGEIDFKLQRNRLKLKRYRRFDWKIHFLKTFAFLLVLDIFMLLLQPLELSQSEFLILLAISLWAIILVCTIFSPIITYWYRNKRKFLITQIQQLLEMKKLKVDHETTKINKSNLRP